MAKMSFVLKNVYRAKWCASHHLSPLCKFFMAFNTVLCDCHIDYHAEIPRSTSFSHYGSGVVIHRNAVLGENVIVAHGVTIGNRMPNHAGVPVIGNNVYIGSGAYLGGGITVGDNARIGANSVVIKDVPANCTAVGNPAKILLPRTENNA